ncbi:MAG: glycosyltransferase family 4 protein [Pyrinomonadaceae bacterium]
MGNKAGATALRLEINLLPISQGRRQSTATMGYKPKPLGGRPTQKSTNPYKQMQRLNIALVVHDLHSHGGHSVYTRILADQLSRRHDVAVFANRCEQPTDAVWNYYHAGAWRQSALSTVHTFPLGLRAHSSELAKYQIRHMQGYCGGEPNVVTAHICVEAYMQSLRGVSLRHRLSLQLMAAAEARFYRHFEGAVIAISQKVANELQSFYGVRSEISVIPHGVDAARFNSANRERHRSAVRRELGIDEDETLALYVGDLTKSQSHLKELSRAAPDVRVAIVTSSQAYHWRSPNVQILPPTSELQRYYAAADTFVFPTTYDAFGMVVLEAMASGLPVFTSDCAGAAELICSGKDGFVIPLDDWIEATVAGFGDRDSLRAVGLEAEKTAQQHPWSTVVQEVETVYFQIGANSQ